MSNTTIQKYYFGNSSNMSSIGNGEASLVVTSPPYPMIKMWDEQFFSYNKKIKNSMENGKGQEAFELMHKMLDPVWKEVSRILKPGGFACINIGDAVRSVSNNFALYPNHVRIINSLLKFGLTPLPAILWRKQTNSPTKFMGSGMLPAGAYVTLEHEYILISRKNGKRAFSPGAQSENRRESAIFWEERNSWFSDIWLDLKGTRQAMKKNSPRQRSGAFPLELVHRLVSMYSVKNDLIVDPFLGTGTTLLACAINQRNGIGFELQNDLKDEIEKALISSPEIGKQIVDLRISNHLAFVENRIKQGKSFKYISEHHGFPVMTTQEIKLLLNAPETAVKKGKNSFEVTHSKHQAQLFAD